MRFGLLGADCFAAVTFLQHFDIAMAQDATPSTGLNNRVATADAGYAYTPFDANARSTPDLARETRWLLLPPKPRRTCSFPAILGRMASEQAVGWSATTTPAR